MINNKDFIMRISTIGKLVQCKTAVKDYVQVKIANLRKPNYDKYVKISERLHPETYDYLQGIKSVLGNFLKKGNYEATFEPVHKQPQKVSMNLFAKEHPALTALYDFFEMAHDKPIKLNKEDIFIKINPEIGEDGIQPAKKIFKAVADVLKSYDEMLNQNLKKN